MQRTSLLRYLILAALISAAAATVWFGADSPTKPDLVGAPQELPVKLSVYQPSQASSGFTLYIVPRSPSVLLINMQGEVVHQWRLQAERAILLRNGNLLVARKRYAEEYSWEGKRVWSYEASNSVHHDISRLENGNTLFPVKRHFDYYPPKKEEDGEPQQPRKGRTDVLLEVTPAGEIAWEWHLDQHLDFFSCGARDCGRSPYAKRYIDQVRDWSHTNTVRELPPNRWFDAGDLRFRPGNIIFMPRNLWSADIIDKQTQAVVWSYSGDYKGGLRFPHELHMIPEPLPGAGNILIFDNGKNTTRGSIALEINPVTKAIAWSYEDPERFFSEAAGALQRLPNGNTLISEDATGRLFEVTPQKEIVWEYRDQRGSRRAIRYPPDHCPQLSALPLHTHS